MIPTIDLTGKVAFVTGSTRGIGLAIAEALHGAGARVAVVGRDAGRAQQVASRLGDRTTGVACDVAVEEQVTAAVSAAEAALGPIDILVNNAGLAHRAPWPEASSQDWRFIMTLNVESLFWLFQRLVPSMIERGWGRVINVASVAGKTGAPYVAAYTASKHGVLGLTRSVASEVARTGVTVNAVCPGYVDTDMTTRAVENIQARTGRSAGEALEAIQRMSPQQRLVTPEEVAALALLLASHEGRGITGQAINVDGGTVMF